MHENTKLKKLLESDRQAKRFYDSLSESLRSKIDAASLLVLMKASQSSRPENGEKQTVSRTASSSENTGMIPEGGDLSEGKWKQFGELS